MAQDVKRSDLAQGDLGQRRQRRSTRRAFGLWGIGFLLVAGAAILVWVFVFVPRGGPGVTAQQTSGAHGGSTGVLANQGSGQSTAAKNNAVIPQTSPSVGAGQNSPGAAAQIEQSAGPLKLTDQQREQIRSYFAGKQPDRANNVDFSLAIGSAVPQQMQLQKLPDEVASAMGGYRGDDYIFVRDQLVIVEPNARRVVAIVPNAG